MAVVISLPDAIVEKIKEITGIKDGKRAVLEFIYRAVYGGISRSEIDNKLLGEILYVLKRLEEKIDRIDKRLTVPESVKSSVQKNVAKDALYRKDIDIDNNIYTFIIKRAKTGKVCVFLYRGNDKIGVLGEFTDDGFKVYDNHIRKVCENINVKEDIILNTLYSFVSEYVEMVYNKIVEEAYGKGGKISSEEVRRILEEHGLSYERFKVEHPVEIIQEDESTWRVVEKI